MASVSSALLLPFVGAPSLPFCEAVLLCLSLPIFDLDIPGPVVPHVFSNVLSETGGLLFNVFNS